ncbi:MAG TPA: ATP-binding protein [Longimicrobium sp.]
MTIPAARASDYLTGLVNELRKLPTETPWLEFKENNASPDDIGQYLSALSNAAALNGKAHAYMVWGVSDTTHDITGTDFKPATAKKGNEDLESWLLRLLSPRLHFRFFPIEIEGKPVVLLEIPRAHSRPTQFQGDEFIRIGSYRKRLKEYPDMERALWRIFDETPFEELRAIERLSDPEVLERLDYPVYFDLLGLPLPSDRDAILARLADDDMIVPNPAGGWDITNLGGILFAKNLNDFGNLARKAVRVIIYEGQGRLKTILERSGRRGYAAGFERLIDFIDTRVPRNEVIGKALRREVPMYPERAIRELVANALIHQDFSVTGSGPMIELFEDRLEITNPGIPLMSTNRFLDTPPRSRNEALAAFMRRIGVCEERGSGVDKVVSLTEEYQLPAPIFESPDGATRTVLFGHRPFSEMDRADRIRACYLHACLRYVERNQMTNSSLRERFGIDPKNSAIVSRIIADAIAEGVVKAYDPAQGKKYARYVPFWA